MDAIETRPLKIPGTAWLLAFALFLGCSRGDDGRQAPIPDPMNKSAAASGPDTPRPGGSGDPTQEPSASTPGALGTGVLVCDKYIRLVCGCAEKRQSPALQRSCDLARLSLPEWKKSHNEEDEELAVIKACQRAFLYIQSTGQCDDVSY